MPADGSRPRKRSQRASIREAAQGAASSSAGASSRLSGPASPRPRRPSPVRPVDPQPLEIIGQLRDDAIERGQAADTEFEEYVLPESVADAGEFPPFAEADGLSAFDAQRTLGEWLEGVIPAEAQMHFLNAGKEFAQGVQVTLDHHTGRRAKAPDSGRAHHIDVE